MFGGWVSHALADEIQSNEITALFSDGSITARSLATFYTREALGNLGIGVVLVVPTSARPSGSFVSLVPKLPVAAAGHSVTPTPNTEEFGADELPQWTKALLQDAEPRLPEAVALALGARPAPRQAQSIARTGPRPSDGMLRVGYCDTVSASAACCC